jgi:hypothetical protein
MNRDAHASFAEADDFLARRIVKALAQRDLRRLKEQPFYGTLFHVQWLLGERPGPLTPLPAPNIVYFKRSV